MCSVLKQLMLHNEVPLMQIVFRIKKMRLTRQHLRARGKPLENLAADRSRNAGSQ